MKFFGKYRIFVSFSVTKINKVYVQIMVVMSDLFPNERDHTIVFVFFCICLFVRWGLGSPCFSKQNIKHKMYKIKDCK